MQARGRSRHRRLSPAARTRSNGCPSGTIATPSVPRCLCLTHERAKHAVRAHLGDRDRCNPADKVLWSHDLNRLKIWGASDNLARMAPGPFEQNVEGGAEALRVEGRGIAIDYRLQAVKSLGFYILVDLIRHFRGRRSRTGRVFEREGAGKADRIDERERALEIALALAGKSDNEV